MKNRIFLILFFTFALFLLNSHFVFAENGGGGGDGGDGGEGNGGCTVVCWTETEKQTVIQHKCTLGACGGVITILEREVTRSCSRSCCTCGVGCTEWSCGSWSSSSPTKKNFDTSQTPWLVCTYRYDKLTSTEKERIEKAGGSLNYPYSKIKCTEGDCPEVDEVVWFPPIFDDDDEYGDFYAYTSRQVRSEDCGEDCWHVYRDSRFFDIVQVTCWGKCLDPVKYPHYFGGSINPKREWEGRIENEEQNPSALRLPAKFGWEFKKEKTGIDEWEEAIEKAKEECKNCKEGRGGDCTYCSQLDEKKAKKILKEKVLGEKEFDRRFKLFEFETDDNTYSLIRGLGVGSFYFKIEKNGADYLTRHLYVAEGKSLPEWQKPLYSSFSRKDMYDYFDYYFLSDTKFYPREMRNYGFPGYFQHEGKNYYLYVYSPSQDSKRTYRWIEYKDPNENDLTKEVQLTKPGIQGPCKISPFQNYRLKVYPCCGLDPENCSPIAPTEPNETDWNFYTLGPEIKSILGIRIKEIATTSYDSKEIIKERGKIYRFIDVDWDRVWPSKVVREKFGLNSFYMWGVEFDQYDEGPDDNCQDLCGKNPELDLIALRGECHKLNNQGKREICEKCKRCKYKVDYVDVEWCSYPDSFVAPFYKGKEDQAFPLQSFFQEKPKQECENVTSTSLCQENPCNCYKYQKDGTETSACQSSLIVDKFFQYPTFRISTDTSASFPFSSFECALSPPYQTTTCIGAVPLGFYDKFENNKLVSTKRYKVEELEVVRDVYAEFGDYGSKKTYWVPFSLKTGTPWTPQPWWEEDKFSPIFSSFIPNSVIVGVPNKGSGLRWDFYITTLPKTHLCNYEQDSCFGEREDQYPVGYKMIKKSVKGYLAPEKEFDKENKRFGIYRTQALQLPRIERFLSVRLKIKDENEKSFVEYLPKSSTQSTSFNFKVWEFWNSLPPLNDAISRLKKEFTFYFYPCSDEMGFYCLSDHVDQKVKITGEPPQSPFKEEISGPPPPKKIKIPHYFNWDASLGAASYWIKFFKNENEVKTIFHPDLTQVAILKSNLWVDWLEEDTPYYWQVKTCADMCSKDDPSYLQCGEWSEKFGPVFGYYLDPPNQLLGSVQFLPNEEISLSWAPIPKGADCTHLKIFYKGGMFEKRKDCIEKAKSSFLVFDKILTKEDLAENGKYTLDNSLLPTSTEIIKDEKTGISTNVCLGNYYYQIQYCTGENCGKRKEECKPPAECETECKGKEDYGNCYLDCVDCYYSSECQEAGAWSYLASFEIVTKKYEKRESAQVGFGTCKNFIHCSNCTFADIPKVVANILNCILWTLSPIAVVFLLLYTGIRFYFSFGSSEEIERAKSIWKAVGIGWLIMLFSWTIINLIGKTLNLPGW